MTVPRTDKRGNTGNDSPPMLRFLIAYESVEIGLQALQLYQRLAKRFGEGYRFELNVWKFEALGVPSLARVAAHEAVAADLVVIAANRDDRVPLDLRSWMDKWIGKKADMDSALVLLSKRPNGREEYSAPMLAFLRDVANRGNMTFLCDAIETAALRNAFLERIQRGDRRISPAGENLSGRISFDLPTTSRLNSTQEHFDPAE